MSDLLASLRAALDRPPRTVAEWEALPAAVLVPLYQAPGEGWRMVFTLRTNSVESHKGQVAFPGGRSDPGDADRVATALREAQEEIGLSPESVQVLGQLDELLTVTRYRVTPVVGAIPWPTPLALSHSEVSEVFSVPLGWLADPANLEVRLREVPFGNGPIPVYYYRPYEGKVIWGATARIVQDFLERLGMRPDPRPAAGPRA
ncbi:MAG: CoA pyrophosphatase [Chloroflexi bacterium]|nr:CoA pyrophosphatase [Chloroflexota bacterium]